MAEEVGKGKVLVEADTKNLGRDIADGVDRESGSISKAFSGIGKVAGAAFKVAAVAAIGAVVAGAALAKASVDAASDLAESQSKVAVVFGDNADQIVKWADTAATAFGQSKQQALEAAGTYGNLFQAFGVGQKPAQEMSQTLVGLAADLASFNNTSIDDAIAAIQSGLSGETEPLKRFGVALTDDRLKAEALAQGLISTTKDALTPAAKSQAAYALIMRDTTLAQGDFARTSDGLANKQRILAAQFTNVKAQIGQALIPAFLAVVTFLSDRVIPTVGKLWDFFQGGLTGEFTNEGSGVFLFINRLGMRIGELVDWIRSNWPQIRTIIGNVLQAVGRALAWVADVVLTGLRVAIRETVEWVREHWDTIRDVFVSAATNIAATVVGIIDTVRSIVTWLADNESVFYGIAAVIGTVLVAAIASWTATTWAHVTALIAQAAASAAAYAPLIAIAVAIGVLVAAVIYAYQNWGWFRDAVDAVASFMRDTLWPILQAVFTWMVDNIPPIIAAIVGWITGSFVPALQSIYRWIADNVFPIVQTLAGFFVDYWTVAFIIAKTAVETVITVAITLWGWLQTLWDRSEGFRVFLANVFRLAVQLTGEAIDAVSTAVSTVYGWLQTLWDRAEPFRAFLAGAFWLAVTVVSTAFDAIATAVSTVWGWLQTIWDKGVEVVGYFEGAFKTGIELVAGAWDIVSKAIETAVGWLGDVISWAGKALTPLQKVIDAAAAVKDIITLDIDTKVAPGVGSLDPGKFNPPSAFGGPVAAGRITPVNEFGRPEYFTPNQAGWIIPDYRADHAQLDAVNSAQQDRRSGWSGPLIGEANFYDDVDVDGVFRTAAFHFAGV